MLDMMPENLSVHMGSGQVICFFLNWGPVSGVSGCWHKELWCPEICPRCPLSRKTCYLGLVPILVSFDILEESLRSLKWVFSGSCLGENCLTFWAYFFPWCGDKNLPYRSRVRLQYERAAGGMMSLGSRNRLGIPKGAVKLLCGTALEVLWVLLFSLK